MRGRALGAARASRRSLAWLNVLGGAAVLASSAWGVVFRPESMRALWGGVPGNLRPAYEWNMLLAALGYLPFTPYVLRLEPDATRVFDRFGYGVFLVLYALVRIPSALWLPLTIAYLDAPSTGLWWMIRAVLAAAGAGALGLVAALLALRDPPRGVGVALLGLVPFCVQTALLDAILWPACSRAEGHHVSRPASTR
jgi:hypothetical protein